MKIPVDQDIVLKEIETDDAAAIFRAIDQGREYLREWLPFVDSTLKEEDSQAFVQSVLNAPSELSEKIYTIIYRDRFAGLIGFKGTDLLNRKTEIGYWLAEEFQHKGIVTRACKELIRIAFSEMNINRVQIKVATGNRKSQRVAERLGCTREGVERDGELLNSGFTDLFVYSMLKRDCLL